MNIKIVALMLLMAGFNAHADYTFSCGFSENGSGFSLSARVVSPTAIDNVIIFEGAEIKIPGTVIGAVGSGNFESVDYFLMSVPSPDGTVREDHLILPTTNFKLPSNFSAHYQMRHASGKFTTYIGGCQTKF